MKTKPTQGTEKSIPGGNNFLISVYHQENHSMQCSIHWLDTGKKVHFRSELELMNLMNAAVCNKSGEQALRSWEDEIRNEVS